MLLSFLTDDEQAGRIRTPSKLKGVWYPVLTSGGVALIEKRITAINVMMNVPSIFSLKSELRHQKQYVKKGREGRTLILKALLPGTSMKRGATDDWWRSGAAGKLKIHALLSNVQLLNRLRGTMRTQACGPKIVHRARRYTRNTENSFRCVVSMNQRSPHHRSEIYGGLVINARIWIHSSQRQFSYFQFPESHTVMM